MRGLIESWMLDDGGAPTFIVKLRGNVQEIMATGKGAPAIGISMEADGTLYLWLNEKRNVLKKYPVSRRNPFVAKSTLRMLDALIRTQRVRFVVHYDIDYGPGVALRPQVPSKEFTTYFNSDAAAVYSSMRERLAEVMLTEGISTEGNRGAGG